MSEEVKPPSHVATDWNFYLNHDHQNYKISSYFDKENWKINTLYRLRISHIYDPSHFWVVSKETELDTLHRYLHDFYTKYKDHYKISTANIKINTYCIAYTEGAFYRSIIVNIPQAIKNETWAFAFLIDFGFMAKVSLDDIYFMTKGMYSVPRFAIRATLSGISPVGTTTWSSKVVARFNTLANNKVLLCQLTNINCKKRILYLRLGEFNWQTKVLDSINDFLVVDKLAKQMSILDIREMKHSERKKGTKCNRKTKLPFLLPSFHTIESGYCVDSVVAARNLDEFVSW